MPSWCTAVSLLRVRGLARPHGSVSLLILSVGIDSESLQRFSWEVYPTCVLYRLSRMSQLRVLSCHFVKLMNNVPLANSSHVLPSSRPGCITSTTYQHHTHRSCAAKEQHAMQWQIEEHSPTRYLVTHLGTFHLGSYRLSHPSYVPLKPCHGTSATQLPLRRHTGTLLSIVAGGSPQPGTATATWPAPHPNCPYS